MMTLCGWSQNPTAVGMGGIHVLEKFKSLELGIVQSSCAVSVYSFPEDSFL